MTITVEQLEALDACQTGIDAFVRCGGNVLQLLPEHYLWGVPHFPEMIDYEHLDRCAKQEPASALEYAADTLTPERLDWCAEQEPVSALKCAAGILTPERLDWCAEQEPAAALRYAIDRLTPERRDWCDK